MVALRLAKIAQLITLADVVADIGSDHGLLPLLLVKNGHSYVYASENKIGPYARLKRETSLASNKIITALADGTSNLPVNVNTLVLAGMGGSLISEILLKHPEELSKIKKIIASPQGSEAEVRSTLNKLGFMIVNEEVVREGAHYYEIIVALPGKQTLSEFEIEFGPINVAKRTSEFSAKWRRTYEINENILKKPNLTTAKQSELMIKQTLIQKALAED